MFEFFPQYFIRKKLVYFNIIVYAQSAYALKFCFYYLEIQNILINIFCMIVLKDRLL